MTAALDRVTCPACGGRGGEEDMYEEFDQCPLCDGAGQTSRQRADEWRVEDADTACALAAWTKDEPPAGDKH